MTSFKIVTEQGSYVKQRRSFGIRPISFLSKYRSAKQKTKTIRKSSKSRHTCCKNLQIMSLVAFGLALMSYAAYQMLIPTVVDQLETICQKSRTFDLVKLNQILHQRVFGQNIAIKSIVDSIHQYYLKEASQGPLVLSFHGGEGTGKTFVAHILSESIHQDSHTHWVFPSHTETKSEFGDHQGSTLKMWIRNSLASCATTLFVFEDADKAPKWQMDAVEDVLRSWSSDEESADKAAIFVFISRVGHAEIKEHFISVMSRNLTRDDVAVTDLEMEVKSLLNDASNVFDSQLVTTFVIFLPLERHHVASCAQVAMEMEYNHISNSDLEQIFRYLSFEEDFPTIARIGCKKVAALVSVLDLN